MFGRGAGGEIAVALAFVMTQGADPLHVTQHQRLGAYEVGLVDPEGPEQLRQFVRRMRSLTDQFIQVAGRNAELARNAVEIGAVHLAHLVQLPPVPQPGGERIEQHLDGGIWLVLRGHWTPPVASHMSATGGKGCCARSNKSEAYPLDGRVG